MHTQSVWVGQIWLVLTGLVWFRGVKFGLVSLSSVWYGSVWFGVVEFRLVWKTQAQLSSSWNLFN